MRLRSAAIFGGVNQNPQVRRLRQGVDILVATPGRLLDLVGQGFVDLSAVEVLVLDEADRMLDMGFVPDVRRIIGRLPERRQTLFFSATMPPEIARLSASILHDPTVVHAATVSSTIAALAQSVYFVSRENKPSLLDRLLRDAGAERTLVFTRTRHGADKLARRLQRTGVRAEAIHGDKSQGARTKALAAFKSGRTPVLVATDVAARGIDVDEVRRVVNYEIPNVAETYVHRVGRTARAGASGIAVSFCDREEIGDLRAIERLIDQPLRVADDAGDLVFIAPAPAPARDRAAHGRTSKNHGRTSENHGSTHTRSRSRTRTRRRGAKRSTVSSVTSR
jgi:ATP-dependent RNA helicase RhlE